MNIEALAERVEELDGDTRFFGEVEKEIALALGWTHHVEQHDDQMTDDVWTSPDGTTHAWWPFCLRSLDAAMTLVPKGRYLRLTQVRFGMWQAELWHTDKSVKSLADVNVLAAAPAIAITAAVLRARHTTTAPQEAKDG